MAAPLRLPLQITLAALVAFLVGNWFMGFFPGYLPKIGGLWSAVSAVMVSQPTRREASTSASLRLLGSAIGALISALSLWWLPFHPLSMATALIVTMLLCQSLNIAAGARLAVCTVMLLMVTASLDPTLNPGMNALLRFLESCIGTAVAVVAVWLWPGAHRPGSETER